MSKYSEFSIGNEKTRVEGELENQLLNITNYKNQSQNFGELDGLDKRGSAFGFEIEKMGGFNNDGNDRNDDKTVSAIFNDPRYSQKEAREGSRKNKNVINTTNKTLSGLDTAKYSTFSESNFEDPPQFRGLTRGMELNANPLVRGQGDVTINNNNPIYIINKFISLYCIIWKRGWYEYNDNDRSLLFDKITSFSNNINDPCNRV
jgi:hypothetical protein